MVQWFILSNNHKNHTITNYIKHLKEEMLDEDPAKREARSAESSALSYTTST